jgi:hypothetical protein
MASLLHHIALIPCSSGLHSWSVWDADKAARCCNGWVPVKVPWGYRNRLREWANSRDVLYNPYAVLWYILLVPSSERELLAKLQGRIPDWLWGFYGPTPTQDHLN